MQKYCAWGLCLLMATGAACTPGQSGFVVGDARANMDGGVHGSDGSTNDTSPMDGAQADASRDSRVSQDAAVPQCGRYVYRSGREPVFVNDCTNGSCRFSCLQPDRCGGVTCRANETCFNGACVPGCFTYQGISCAAGQRAVVGVDGTRICVGALDRGECDECGPDEYCKASCVPNDPCAGVSCPNGGCCVNGACVTRAESPCCGVFCAAGTLCANGTCVGQCSGRPVGSSGMESEAEAQNCHATCPANARCVLGQCQPTPCSPNCPADFSRAAAADGCGGVCPCPNGLRANNGTCCTPTCTTPCGSDSCGGTCPAPAGSVCRNGNVCTPSCTGSSACADDGCGGVCPGCDGVGETCRNNMCCTRDCPADFSRAGQSDGCGGVCGCPSGTIPWEGATPYCCPSNAQRWRNGSSALCCAPPSAVSYNGTTRAWECCTPNCTNRAGQPNGCGGVCPCPTGQVPYGGQCCMPSGQACQSNGCGGINPAPAGSRCHNGTVCTPNCTNSNGGSDGCGGICPCAPGAVRYNGTCCTPNCATPCANNSCGGQCAPPPGSVCHNGTVCTPSCAPNTCGSNGCGGTCTCSGGTTCANGACVSCPTSCPAGQYLLGCSCYPLG